MWYAVETVFIDGKLFGSKCAFIDGDSSPVGHCYADLTEEPMNQCNSEFDGRIEIHLDWFESEKLAKDFCNGKITYIHYYDGYFENSIKTTLTRFRKREIIPVNENEGILPYRGIYKTDMLDYKPYWV